MKANQAPFFNYNQMLVVSVFFHLSLLIVIVYLPKADLASRIIKPAFMVDLVDIPMGAVNESTPSPAHREERSPAPKRVAVKPPPPRPVAEKPAPKPVAVKPPPEPVVPKFSSAPKPVAVKVQAAKEAFKPAPLPAQTAPEPPAPQTTQRANPLLERLEEVASLDAEAPRPVRKKSASSDPFLDQTFQDLEALKAHEATRIQEPDWVTPPPAQEDLVDFGDLKMKEAPANEKQKSAPATSRPVRRLAAEDEFQALARQEKLKSARKEAGPEALQKSLRELESLKQMKPETVSRAEAPRLPESPPVSRKSSSASPLLKKLDSLEQATGLAISFDMEIHDDLQAPVKFESNLRNLKTPDLSRSAAPMRSAERAPEQQANLNTGRPGAPSADALSLYLGKVRKKIFENWKDPLGGGHSELEVSFYIFPQGNIENPSLVKSSGSDRLNNLALQAIKDSAPFPAFPEGLREPNLFITINFSYVQKKS